MSLSLRSIFPVPVVETAEVTITFEPPADSVAFPPAPAVRLARCCDVLNVTAPAAALTFKRRLDAFPASLFMVTAPALTVSDALRPWDCEPERVNVPVPFLVIDFPAALEKMPENVSE